MSSDELADAPFGCDVRNGEFDGMAGVVSGGDDRAVAEGEATVGAMGVLQSPKAPRLAGRRRVELARRMPRGDRAIALGVKCTNGERGSVDDASGRLWQL